MFGGTVSASASALDTALSIVSPLGGWLLALGGVLVAFAAAGWRQHHRQQTNTEVSPDNVVGSKRGLLWGVFVLLVALGIPLTQILLGNAHSTHSLEIQCTASQWKWHFAYQSYQQHPLNGIAFISAMRTPSETDNRQLALALFGEKAHARKADELLDVDQPLVLPVGAKVRFVITSEDSVHGWWIPAFNVKKQAIPGFLQNVDAVLPTTPGIYRGLCSQLCGQDQALMPIVVQLLPVAEFERWLKRQPAILASKQQRPIPDTLPDARLMELGRTVYRERCELCHGPEGKGHSSRVPPLAGNSALSGEPRALLQLLLNGRNVMPGMRDILATDELAALTTYVRMTWIPQTENLVRVQPIDVQAAF